MNCLDFVKHIYQRKVILFIININVNNKHNLLATPLYVQAKAGPPGQLIILVFLGFRTAIERKGTGIGLLYC